MIHIYSLHRCDPSGLHKFAIIYECLRHAWILCAARTLSLPNKLRLVKPHKSYFLSLMKRWQRSALNLVNTIKIQISRDFPCLAWSIRDNRLEIVYAHFLFAYSLIIFFPFHPTYFSSLYGPTALGTLASFWVFESVGLPGRGSASHKKATCTQNNTNTQ
jgi:hypothetical protein